MKNLPQPVWAVILAFFGSTIALCCLYHRTEGTVPMGVLAIASNLVAGALGAFAGHATANKSDVTRGNDQAIIPQEK